MIRANHTKKIFSVHVGKVAWGYVAVCACDDGVAQLCLPRPSEKEALEFVTREIAPRYPRYVNERTPVCHVYSQHLFHHAALCARGDLQSS